MTSQTENDSHGSIEAVVGIFEDPDTASQVASSLKGPEINLQRVSRRNPDVASEMPDIVYDPIEEISVGSVAKGALQGGAIGAGSGLLLLGVPVLNVLAPVGAALAGAFIGGVAGADESNRSIELPDLIEYQRLLALGKSIIVISGTESERLEAENKMKELGALKTHQHPPVRHVVHNSSEE